MLANGRSTPIDLKRRREEILQLLRTDTGRTAVIRRLKELMGLPQDQPLPNGTPIISTLIRLEHEDRQSRP